MAQMTEQATADQQALKQLSQQQKQVQERNKQADSEARRSAAETRSRASNETKQKIRRLESKIKALTDENQALLDKQAVTNNSIGDYISEMSTMLSSAELESALAMEQVDTDSDDDYEARDEEGRHLDEIEFEADEGRPHAGTGGSSKLRSRPQNSNFATLQQHEQQRPGQA